MSTSIKRMILTLAGAIYFMAVSACDDGKSGAEDIAPPAVPAGVSATDGVYGNKVTITWSAAENASTYKIYKAINSTDGDYVCIARGINVTGYEDATISVNRVYYYKVKAVNAGGESELSSSDSGFAGDGRPNPPLAPANFTASDTSMGFIELSWSASEGAASYKIFRCAAINGVYGEIASVTDATYMDNDIDMLTRYYYKVKAVNEDGESAFSNYDGGRSLPPLPALPSGVSATDGVWGNKVIVTWNALPEADTYTVYRADLIDGTYALIASGLTAATHTDYDVTSGSPYPHYFYKISGANVTGEGERSAADEGWADPSGTVLPDVPAGVAATDDQNDQITVSWNAAAHATSYKVYRASAADAALFDESALVASDVTELSWIDTTVTAGVTWYYRVRAVNNATNGGDSGLSSADQGYAMGDAPAFPLNVQATDGNTYTITVSWNEVAGAVSYRVYRSDTVEGIYAEVVRDLTATSWSDTGRSFGVHYYYKVTAVNAWGESAQSDANDGYCILPAPAGLDAVDGGSRIISVSWNAVEGAESYILQRKWRGNGSWQDIATINGPDVSWTDNAPGLWLQFDYRVRAVAGGYQSAYSNVDSEWDD